MRSIVSDSIGHVRSKHVPGSLQDLVVMRATSPLGRLGAPQEYLYHIVRICRPTTGIETGVYRGVSTAFMLAAMADNHSGQLTSIDLPSASYLDERTRVRDSSPLFDGEETGFAIPESLRNRWTLRIGDSRTLLKDTLSNSGKIDLFYHDSAHTYEVMKWEYETALESLRHGGVLLSDDVQWNGAFREFSQRPEVIWSAVLGHRLGVALIA